MKPGTSSQPKLRQRPYDQDLTDLIDLCLNTLDAYSAVLFTASKSGGPLHLRAHRSLSGNIDPKVIIYPGKGLVGWAYKNNTVVNVDKVRFGSDRLLFYTCDEGIKSFMAVPLPEIQGVLAIDSKQRYFFTDKSAKLLMQFGQSISNVFRRLFGRPVPSKTTGDGNQAAAPEENVHENEVCALWQGIEFCLSRSDNDGGGLNAALELVRRFSGLSWAFLTVIKAGDEKNYYLVSASANVPDNIPHKYPMASGLAGWLHTKHKVLVIDKLKVDSRNSYIFQPDEPIKGVRSFYGWPILYNGQPRGSLILAGKDGEILNAAHHEAVECVISRLAAQFHLDRLIMKVMEMDYVDSQTGLSHRGHFVESLNHMLEVADLKQDGVDLFVLATSGLGSFASEHGQEAANDLLHSISKQLKDGIRPNWRLGHVSYGVFTLASPSADAAEAKTLIAKFKKSLENWPLVGRSGRADLGLFPAMASYPRDGDTPEQLLELALTALAESDED